MGLVLLVRLARDSQVTGPQTISASWRSRAGPSPSLSAASACSPSSGRPRARSDRSGRGRIAPGYELGVSGRGGGIRLAGGQAGLAELGEQDRECGGCALRWRRCGSFRTTRRPQPPRSRRSSTAPSRIPADLAGPYARQARGPAHAGRSCRAALHLEYAALIPSPTATITSTPSSTLVPASPMRSATSAPRK